jgi:Skp family chaperone for outer membrane proteins
MLKSFQFSRVLVAGLAFGAAVASAPAAEGVKPADAASLQKGVEQFNAQRDRVLSDYQAQLEQLKGATEEQRQQILEKLQAQKKELDALQREQGKQLREELRKLRQSSPAPRK